MDLLTGYISEEDIQDLDNLNDVIYCMICKVKKYSYKCPRCAALTCSLECCRLHKIEMDCNGQRDRTNYVSIQQFTESQLKSDYHFLEDVLQVNK